MSKIPFAIHNGQSLNIQAALDLKEALGNRFQAGVLTCPECGEPIKPHNAGGKNPAHFEHYDRNPNCSISHTRPRPSTDKTSDQTQLDKFAADRRQAFEEFLRSDSTERSGKTTSYIRGLELIEEMIAAHPMGFEECRNLWAITSTDRLSELSERLTLEKKKGESSEWNLDGMPKSYLKDGFCSAALSAYLQFLTQYSLEKFLESQLRGYDGDLHRLEEIAKTEPVVSKKLLDEWKQISGKEVLRQIKTRANQNVFRRLILDQYSATCCVTGNPVPTLLTASHIKPWKDCDDTEKLDRTNGLCLAKTQDAAFDQGLMTLDEKLRVVLSKRIRDHHTLETIQSSFLKYEGNAITLPHRFRPDPRFLAYHREVVFVA